MSTVYLGVNNVITDVYLWWAAALSKIIPIHVHYIFLLYKRQFKTKKPIFKKCLLIFKTSHSIFFFALIPKDDFNTNLFSWIWMQYHLIGHTSKSNHAFCFNIEKLLKRRKNSQKRFLFDIHVQNVYSSKHSW